jgi:hypothetical protein
MNWLDCSLDDVHEELYDIKTITHSMNRDFTVIS